jgi:hypothetical protein
VHVFLVTILTVFWVAMFATFAWLFGIWLPRSGKPEDPDDDDKLRPATA